MQMENKNVYLNTMSACCSAGLTHDAIFESALLGKTGVKKHKGFLTDGSSSAIGKIETTKSFDTLLIEQVQKILEESNLDNFSNTFLAVGTSVGGMAWAEHQFIKDRGSYRNIELKKQSLYSISHTLNQKFNFKDTITFSTACTSSSNAIVFAKELLEAGAYDNVLVVGADSISYTTVNGFNALGVLSSECAIPFDANRTGMNVAEGVGAILFSTKPSDIQLIGVGCNSDAYNITNPHPDGVGAKMAMQKALDDANLEPSSIDYINAHGTGTIANDSSEGKAIMELFGDSPLVGSTKSITGHTLGACGSIELIISAMALKKQKIPANLNLKTKELEGLNLVEKTTSKKINFVLSNAFAFGGNNVSIILKKVKKATDEN
ncbi:MAG: beta-ketoacyl-[acyl-carrier-protein] synthase family protein [Sulfurovaceae bacterium]|nr:beta-ketoacyl-[acyl-carrier-protein] synthase family protein [Sulfurovaceae bacterium]